MSLDLLAAGRASMEMEAEAIACAARRLDVAFASAVRIDRRSCGQGHRDGAWEIRIRRAKTCGDALQHGHARCISASCRRNARRCGDLCRGRSHDTAVEERNHVRAAAADSGVAGIEFAADWNYRQPRVAAGEADRCAARCFCTGRSRSAQPCADGEYGGRDGNRRCAGARRHADARVDAGRFCATPSRGATRPQSARSLCAR